MPDASEMMDLLHKDLEGIFYVDPDQWNSPDLDEQGATFHWGRLEPARSWSHVEDDPENYVYVNRYLVFSDYSGSAVERANKSVFMEEYADEPGIYEVYGGQGTEGVAVRMTVDNTDIKETFAALSDHPIINDESMHEIITEAADEQAEEWGFSDLASKLDKRMGIDIDDPSSDEFQTFFWAKMSDVEEFPYMEEGGHIVFPLTKMAVNTDFDDLAKHRVKYTVEE